MSLSSHIRRFVGAGVWLSCLALMGPQPLAQTPAPDLKAAFTLNFAKFTHRPDGRPATSAESLRVCLVGRSRVAASLAASEGETVGGARVAIDYLRLPGDVSDCHLLYISELDLDRERRLLSILSRLPVLTVSDLPGFAAAGGMIELVLLERRLRFEINLDSVRASGLRLDPKLLRLARRLFGEGRGEPD